MGVYTNAQLIYGFVNNYNLFNALEEAEAEHQDRFNELQKQYGITISTI